MWVERGQPASRMLPDGLEKRMATAIKAFREGPQHFMHIGRNEDNTVAITEGRAELGGGVYPLVEGSERSALSPIGLILRRVSGNTVVSSSAGKPKYVGEQRLPNGFHVIGLGRNVIVDGDNAGPELEQAFDDMGWLGATWERVLVVGDEAVTYFQAGLMLHKRRPELARLILPGGLTKDELALRDTAIASSVE